MIITGYTQESPSRYFNLIHFYIRDGALERAGPVDEPVGAVDVASVVQPYEGLVDGATHGRVHCKADAGPVV